MNKTKLAACLLACVAMVCIAATNVPGPLEVVGITNSNVGQNISFQSTTNVPIHVLPVVQQPQDTISQWLVMVIPVIVPLLIDYLKKTFPNVPSWVLPSLAPVLGAVSDLFLQAAGVQTGGTIKGALLGSAGVGLRELANQVTAAVKPPPNDAKQEIKKDPGPPAIPKPVETPSKPA